MSTTQKPKQGPALFLEKNQPIIKRIRAGESIDFLSREIGIGKQALYAMIKKYTALEAAASSKDPFDLLSTRARNCLRGLDSVEQIQSAINSGELYKRPNIGKKTIAEIVEWSKLV